jgi:hypothetical protein
MKKTGLVYLLAALVLSAAAMLLRSLELSTAIDADGLALFRPVTAVLIALTLLTAAFFILFARRSSGGWSAFAEDYRSLGLPGVIWSAACLLAQLYGAWLLFREWKTGSDVLSLILALLAGLAGAGWLCLRLGEWREKVPRASRFLAGALVTLFYGVWLVVYYRDEAPNPALLLTVYGFLALCACTAAACCFTGGVVGRMKPGKTLVFCGLALYLSLVALVRSEPTAFRLFWTVAAVQFAHSAVMLLSPLDKPDPEEAPAEETPEETEAPASQEAEEE